MWYSCKSVQFLAGFLEKELIWVSKEKLESSFNPNSFSLELYLILKSSILAVQLSSELIKRWNLLPSTFIWFSLNQPNRELVDCSKLLITLSRLKSTLYDVLLSTKLPYHIRLCQKICHRYRYWKVRDSKLTLVELHI